MRIVFLVAEVSYFGENWILTLKLTVRRGWYIIKSRHHPNTLAVASWTPRISAQTDLEVRFSFTTAILSPRKKERSPKKQRQREENPNKQKTPHSQRGTLKQQGPSEP